ncbi:MAG: anti-anti-sigma factor [Gammaproteobacteria bacterium]|nr:MAG: anti-anti-sigma factor [Gammaproteobacteria bacterium]
MKANSEERMQVSPSIDFRKDEQGMYIRIRGHFDFNLHSDFKELLKKAKDSSTAKCTIDLGTTEDLDSSALGMLLLLRDAVGGEKSNVAIINSKPEIKAILNMANFEKMFHIS